MSIEFYEEESRVDRLSVPSPTLPPATTTNCWRIYSGSNKARIIIDPAATKREIQHQLIEMIPSSVQWIFLTHHHRDHIGSVELLRKERNLRVAASQKTASLVSFEIDHIICDNDLICIDDEVQFLPGDIQNSSTETIQALHTPGHAEGHLCFHHLSENWIICGDMLAGEGTILLAPPEGDLEAYFQSLQRLQRKNPTKLLPAHGCSLQIDKIQEYIDHRKMRNTQILDALHQITTVQTPLEVAKKIYDLPPQFYPLAAQQVLCHLQYLERHQMVKSQGTSFIRI